ncbi:MAG: mitofilin family membrane protein [Geminicoccaceae bacterium]
MAGLIGGLLGGAGAFFGAPYVMPQEPNPVISAEVDTVRSQLNALQQNLTGVQNDLSELAAANDQNQGGGTVDLTPIEAQLGDIESRLNQLSGDGGLASELEALDSRVNDLGSAIAEFASGGDDNGEAAQQFADFQSRQQDRVQSIEDRIESLTQATGGLDDLAAQVAALEGQLAARGDELSQNLSAETSALADRIASDTGALQETFTGELSSLSESFETTTSELSGSVSSLGERLDSETARVDEQLTSLSTELESTKTGLNEQLTSLSEQVTTTASRLDQGVEARQQGTALSVVLRPIRDAMANGTAFSSQMDGLKEIAANDEAVAAQVPALEAVAAEGATTQGELASMLDEVRGAVAQAVAGAPEDEDWLGQATDNLLSVVRVTAEDSADTEHPALQAIDQAKEVLQSGDLNEAVAIVAALEGPPAEIAAPWLEAAKARLQANAALAALDEHALELVTATP